ncbi:MAG: radical SAM family heme chaperone HemW [Candidatus Omnitrophica bacterium]|nr:radical SAM family heme chaperone HemW [Candidatus Omnitrophota bacterium]
MSSLYIHIPFCQRKCFYCSFAVSIAQEHRFDEYVDALEKEAARYQGESIATVYLGGGTPSMLSSEQFGRLFKMIRGQFRLAKDCEITIEANPENLDLDKANFLFEAGVNRVSLGVQTLNEAHLKYLGRVHDSFKALSAFNDLRRAGFKNINVDLMYSFPGQSAAEIEQDVKTVLALGSEHVSIYTLTVEENSKFFIQKIKEQDDHDQGDQYQLVTDLLNAGGILQYEVSNFSKPGFESKHNINYWLNGNYVGLGMSSHSHRDGRRSWNTSKLADYLKKAAAGEDPEEGSEELDPKARLREALVFGLRMNRGVDLAELERKFSCAIEEKTEEYIAELMSGGLLSQNKNVLMATPEGRLVLDTIAVKLI